ncbi:hypothetical protein ACFX2F_023843 [Malus domestica]
MASARWLVRMVEIFSGRLGLLGKPLEQAGSQEQTGPLERATRRVMHASARIGLCLATCWARIGHGVTWLGPWPWCRKPWMARLGLA